MSLEAAILAQTVKIDPTKFTPFSFDQNYTAPSLNTFSTVVSYSGPGYLSLFRIGGLYQYQARITLDGNVVFLQQCFNSGSGVIYESEIAEPAWWVNGNYTIFGTNTAKGTVTPFDSAATLQPNGAEVYLPDKLYWNSSLLIELSNTSGTASNSVSYVAIGGHS